MDRIILATGGTGGHIFPALAVAEEIKVKNPHCRILFMGSSHGPEAEIVSKAGYDFVGLPVKGIIGRGWRAIPASIGMGIGVFKALGIIGRVRPEFVLGFGGYAALAGVLAAWLKGVPTGIHEQNAFPGRTNKLLGKLVSRIFLSLPVPGGFATEKTLLVGNPVRSSIRQLAIESAQAKVNELQDGSRGAGESASPSFTPDATSPKSARLLVMGGSLGAKAINEGVVAILPQLLAAGVEIWHQTGSSNYAEIREAYRKVGADSARVEAFIVDMKEAYQWADIALCRAGGSSIAELAVAGVPSILVPFPFATHDHQLHNARFMEGAGAAVILEQKEFYGSQGNLDLLRQTILSLLGDKDKIQDMKQQCHAYAKADAPQQIVEEIDVLLSTAKNG